MTFFTFEEQDTMALLTLKRPPVNALNLEVLEDLRGYLDSIKESSNTRVLIITGTGHRFFAAGADIKGIQGADRLKGREINRLFQTTFQKLANLPIPTICAVNGPALGGGAELAMACDIRVVSEKAEFGLPEASLGLIPGGGGTQRLPRLIPLGKAKDLMFTGCRLSAKESLQYGLAEYVCPEDELLPFTMDLAKQIAQKGPVALRMIKQAVNQGMEMELDHGIQLELDLSEDCFDSEDSKEGINAFLEKRPALFQNK